MARRADPAQADAKHRSVGTRDRAAGVMWPMRSTHGAAVSKTGLLYLADVLGAVAAVGDGGEAMIDVLTVPVKCFAPEGTAVLRLRVDQHPLVLMAYDSALCGTRPRQLAEADLHGTAEVPLEHAVIEAASRSPVGGLASPSLRISVEGLGQSA